MSKRSSLNSFLLRFWTAPLSGYNSLIHASLTSSKGILVNKLSTSRFPLNWWVQNSGISLTNENESVTENSLTITDDNIGKTKKRKTPDEELS